jgi:tRNA dimethylallyltransferase
LKQIAIIAPTASGKTKLSIDLAKQYNAVILSLDSLSVYKYIDIASAKPTRQEQQSIKHFGISIKYPDEKFDVICFIDEYKKAKQYATQHNKNLIIVGGTSFYLKTMLNGLSQVPKISNQVNQKVQELLQDLPQSYKFLCSIDEQYGLKIKQQDKYRIEKALQIYFQTNLPPTKFFEQNKPIPIIDQNQITLYRIDTPKDILRQRISKRTQQMIQNGLIDEVKFLQQHYPRDLHCFNSIGIKECFSYLDGDISKEQLQELITTHTAQLAKRQRTFNKSQFKNVICDSLENLYNNIKLIPYP